MYHRVCDDHGAPASPYVVTASIFERQLQWLASHGYRSAGAIDLVDRELEDAVDGRPGAVVLTFDDGYLDNYTVAFPLLQRYGFTATIFVVTDFQRRINFWDRSGATAGAPLLEAEHVVEMASAGITFGSHCVSHRPVIDLDDADAYAELSRSRMALEDLLGAPVDSLAYPYGIVDRRAKALVARAGYRAAFAVNSGPMRVGEDPLEIRRVLIGDHAGELYMFTKVAGVEKTLRAHKPPLRADAA